MKRLPHGTSGIELLVSLIALLLFFALVVLISWPINAYQCRVRWEGSGLQSRYQFLGGGCFVQTAAGRWIPSDRVREVNPNDAPAAAPVNAPIPTRP